MRSRGRSITLNMVRVVRGLSAKIRKASKEGDQEAVASAVAERKNVLEMLSKRKKIAVACFADFKVVDLMIGSFPDWKEKGIVRVRPPKYLDQIRNFAEKKNIKVVF